MSRMMQDLARLIDLYLPEDGHHKTPVTGVYCLKISKTNRREKNHWRACLGIVAQGCKEIVLEQDVYRCAEGHYTATPVDLPVISRIAMATPDKPFLGLLIDLNPLTLSEVAAQLDKNFLNEGKNPMRALFSGQANENIQEAAVRLAKLFDSQKEDASVLGSWIVKEIFYHFLKGPEGSAIRQFVLSGSRMFKISQAIHSIRAELSREVDASALAKTANMSRSAFFKYFKEATAMSPIQYQKRLRLLEAKRLMVDEGETAEGSAYRVGYRSASQFSREYSRMFGNSPMRDVIKSKTSIPYRAGSS